ncbi:pirin family protein [Desulfovibrio mangrovi]|uniref:pirin family protein n=1 Tax=Desulfovibrio mangrovi TaxID=2976983 RepID=UPI0022472313|nr:pirin family protein [Desulfovibrio mangrovi]UZP66176.1 pirin family protein [Desulfovibrio mangrovi]
MRRSIQHVFQGEPVTEGAGVRLRRVFGYYEVPMFDPFLLLDDFRSDSPEDFVQGFPWHPHRGIETITYVLKGDVEHGDSLGNAGVISSGDVQWMTAGSGIVHQEMPKGDAQGCMHGFQLWANLPARDKMMDPRYRGVQAAEIPVAELPDGVRVKVIAGSVHDARAHVGTVTGPVRDVVIAPEYLDVTVPAGVNYEHRTVRGHTVFVYVIGGSGVVLGGETGAPSLLVKDRMLVLFGDGDSISLDAGSEDLRFLLISGAPLKEPVAWRGPIVMNTDEEIRLAFEEYRNGSFVKVKG